ncbi:Sec-independent protein translocase subunit TatA [Microbacterium sp. NPDC076768]|uniref:Sec-independent protein translocase subunit TatA n=1 Tax=Microbacterium sp. NPDC076768 TaxID=3154858 RepID=UPI00342ED84B
MFAGMQGWHLLIVLVVILLLFGATKLPALAKSMGQSARVFKGEMKAMKEEDAATVDSTVAEPTTVVAEPTTVKDPHVGPETPPRA